MSRQKEQSQVEFTESTLRELIIQEQEIQQAAHETCIISVGRVLNLLVKSRTSEEYFFALTALRMMEPSKFVFDALNLIVNRRFREVGKVTSKMKFFNKLRFSDTELIFLKQFAECFYDLKEVEAHFVKGDAEFRNAVTNFSLKYSVEVLDLENGVFSAVATGGTAFEVPMGLQYGRLIFWDKICEEAFRKLSEVLPSRQGAL